MVDGVTSMSADIRKNCESIFYDTEEQIYYINGRIVLPSTDEKMQHIVHATNVQWADPLEKRVTEEAELPAKTVSIDTLGLPKKK